MASLKKSVMFSELTQNYIRNRTRDENEIAWSQALNEGFKALSWLTRQSIPELSHREWEIILNVYAGSIIEFHAPFRIASDIMDNFGALELTELEPDVAGMVKKVYGMSQIEQFAIMDFVQIFWSNNWNAEPDFDTIITKIKDMI